MIPRLPLPDVGLLGRTTLLAGSALLAASAILPAAAAGQDPGTPNVPDVLSDTVPDDTFADAATESVVRRAMAAREDDLTGLGSYEARLRERIYVGLGGSRFRRERALFEQERAARVRWQADGSGAVQWLGARRSVPAIAGVADAEDEIARDLADGLMEGEDFTLMSLDPATDRLRLGGQWAHHPLADTALHAYQYAPGDTLTLRLADGRRLRVVEIRVRPREPDFHRVAGSLWFDVETGALVRGTYRPSRPWTLTVTDSSATVGPQEEDGVPFFLRPFEARVSYITVEHALYESRWWLPRRFALEAEARAGSLLRAPVTFEWVLDRYDVNEPVSEIPLRGPLPPGWARSERRVGTGQGDSLLVTIVVPPTDSLLTSALLSEVPIGTAPTAFDEEELASIRRDLEALAPSVGDLRPRLVFGLEDRMLRYNRVEGLSVGASGTVPLPGAFHLRSEARIGVADLEPNAEVSLLRGTEERGTRLSVYRRLDHASDWEDPFSLPNSAANLLIGTDRGQYFRTAGAEWVTRRDRRREGLAVRIFAEHQEAAHAETSFHLLKPLGGDRVVGNIAARRGVVGGLGADLRWFRGLDPSGLVLSGRVGGEAGGGDWYYNRLHGAAAAAHPLPFGLSGALEGGAGGAWGEVPVQRRFFLGGPATLRGFRPGDLSGDAFWFGRAEVGSRLPAVRVVAFGDAAWAGSTEAFGTEGWAASVGIGASALDGALRADLARAVREGDDWRLHLYLDALF